MILGSPHNSKEAMDANQIAVATPKPSSRRDV